MSFLSARHRAGLSQAAVAKRLGISSVAVCQWETGKNLPRTALLCEIASLYGCTVDELLSTDDPDASNCTTESVQ